MCLPKPGPLKKLKIAFCLLNISIYGKNWFFPCIHINNIPFEVISEWVVENKQVRTQLNNDRGWGLRKIFFIILLCLNDSLSFFYFLTFYQVPPWKDTVYEIHCLGNTTMWSYSTCEPQQQLHQSRPLFLGYLYSSVFKRNWPPWFSTPRAKTKL